MIFKDVDMPMKVPGRSKINDTAVVGGSKSICEIPTCPDGKLCRGGKSLMCVKKNQKSKNQKSKSKSMTPKIIDD